MKSMKEILIFMKRNIKRNNNYNKKITEATLMIDRLVERFTPDNGTGIKDK